MSLLETIRQDVIEGKIPQAKKDTESALAQGLRADQVLHEALIPAMADVGGLFERDEYYVPEMLLAAKAMKNAMSVLRPILAGAHTRPLATIAMGTVKGDLHDIGKNLVKTILANNGYTVIDLGKQVPAETIITKAVEVNATAIGLFGVTPGFIVVIHSCSWLIWARLASCAARPALAEPPPGVVFHSRGTTLAQCSTCDLRSRPRRYGTLAKARGSHAPIECTHEALPRYALAPGALDQGRRLRTRCWALRRGC